MILVAAYFAETNRAYDFRLDETAPISRVIQDMVSMIAQQEHLTLSRHPGTFLLAERYSGRILSPDSTLRNSDVRSGYELILA